MMRPALERPEPGQSRMLPGEMESPEERETGEGQEEGEEDALVEHWGLLGFTVH